MHMSDNSPQENMSYFYNKNFQNIHPFQVKMIQGSKKAVYLRNPQSFKVEISNTNYANKSIDSSISGSDEDVNLCDNIH